MKSLIVEVAVIIALVLIGFCSTYVFKLGKDNHIEEAAERAIEHLSGIKIEISDEEEL